MDVNSRTANWLTMVTERNYSQHHEGSMLNIMHNACMDVHKLVYLP